MLLDTFLPTMPAPRFFAFFLIALLACGNSSSTPDTDDDGARTTTGIQGARSYPHRPAMMIDQAKSYSATITTPKGVIQLDLDAKAAPEAANNFIFLSRFGFYDGLTFHRVEKNFVIQGGDPNGNGSGGPGYTIPDEASPRKHVDGALAMGRAPNRVNSAGSQFYITIGAQPDLDGGYTVFGHVTAGLDVVRAITIGDRITSIVITEK